MKVRRIPARSGTSERTCHCGAKFNGSDHCLMCGCEQYERFCDASYVSQERESGAATHAFVPATVTWLPGERHAGYDAREDFAGQSDMGQPAA